MLVSDGGAVLLRELGDVLIVGGVLREEGAALEEVDVLGKAFLGAEVLDLAHQGSLLDTVQRVLDPTIDGVRH